MGKGSFIHGMVDAGVINPPSFVRDNLLFEGAIGSRAYGCADTADGDTDLIGIVMPPKAYLFPHLSGHIAGFGPKPPSMKDYQRHHLEFEGRKFDLCIYSLERVFHLMRDNNPNILELLYLPRSCVFHSTVPYEKMRANRHLFLHRRCYDRFHGYGASQLGKMDKIDRQGARRRDNIEKYGYDTKFAYHAVRLILECRQLLETGEMVLDKHGALYREIRSGGWSAEGIREWFDEQERYMIDLLPSCGLPNEPDDEGLRSLLMEQIEYHYSKIRGVSVGVDGSGSTDASSRLADRMRAALAEFEESVGGPE